jgi:hypothetical protein
MGQQQGARACTGRSRGRLAAGMAATDHNDIERRHGLRLRLPLRSGKQQCFT